MKIKNIGKTSFFWMYKGATIEFKPGVEKELEEVHVKAIKGLFPCEIIEDKPVVTGEAETITKVAKNGKGKGNKSSK